MLKRFDGRDFEVIKNFDDIKDLEKKHADKLPPKLKKVIRSGLRKLWQTTMRNEFIKEIRTPYVGPGKYSYGVECEFCKRHMGQSQKDYVTLASGKKSENPKLVYQVDHIDGNLPLNTRTDLGKYMNTLFLGAMRILCYECHIGRVKSEDHILR